MQSRGSTAEDLVPKPNVAQFCLVYTLDFRPASILGQNINLGDSGVTKQAADDLMKAAMHRSTWQQGFHSAKSRVQMTAYACDAAVCSKEKSW
jgi:hypothetical protein